MNCPLFTIVIPTLNRSHCVARAVRSALDQTYPNLEIIVSDNGSRDDTGRVLAQFSDPRLRILRRDTTIPAHEHGNFLIEAARGEYFLGLSDDDYLEPDFARAVVERFLEDPEIVLVYTRCAVHYWEMSVPSSAGPAIEQGAEFVAAHYDQKREVCWCACVTRVLDLRRVGPLRPGTICGDMFFWTRIAFDGKVGCVNRVLSHYVYLDPTTPSTSHSAPIFEWGEESARLMQAAAVRLAERGAPPSRVSGFLERGRRYVANSTANQFVWLALRGALRLALWREALRCRRLIGLHLKSWIRACAGLLVPRPVLRWVIRGIVRRRSLSSVY
jgi:hypothetical protein